MSLSDADRLAILDIVTRADEAASRRDADGYVALFDPDAVLDGAQGRHAGREAMRASVGPIWAAEGPATLHLTLNPVVETGSGDGRAVVRSVLLIVDPADPPAIRATALITQELSRNSGSWRITRRTVAPAGPDRPPGLARLSAAGADTIAPNYGLREGTWRAGSSRVESISARWNP